MDWEDKEVTLLVKTPIFDIMSIVRKDPSGRLGTFVRLDPPDWVTVIPVLRETDRGAVFCMVRQFRHGSGRISLEFPAGMVDPGETPEKAAFRELREETGRNAGRMVLLGSVNPNPAFMNNRTWTYLALEMDEAGPQDLDHHEQILVEECDENEITEMMGEHPLDSAIMVQAFYWYGRYKKGKEGAERIRTAE